LLNSKYHLLGAIRARLCLLALFVLSTFLNNSSANTLRVKRDACADKREEVQNCQTDAYEEFITAMVAGEDGRPDWMARKSCNYITATIEECTNLLVGDCATEEEVNDMKDGEIEHNLMQLSNTIKEWDSEKCPAIEAYLVRNPAEVEEETKEEVAASVDTAAQEKEEEDTDNGEPADSSDDPEKENIKDGGDEEDSENHVDACEEKREEVQSCQTSAYEEFTRAMTAEEDGRPDWMARKSCNYITATIEECTNLLVGDCATEEEVNDMKDGQIEEILDQLSDNIKEWDSEKCPAIEAYLDRNPAEVEEETKEEVAAAVDTAAQEKEEEDTDNGEPADSSDDPEKENTKDGGDEEDSENQVDTCEQKLEEVLNCQFSAYEEFTRAMTAGEDGRPDWMARKSCNYITATIEECTTLLVGDCATEEEVNDMKDGQLEELPEQLSDTIKEWDPEKCPAIKAYLDRNPAKDEEETQEEVAASVDIAVQEKEEEDTDNGEPKDSSEDPEKETTKDGGDEKDSVDQVDAGNDDVLYSFLMFCNFLFNFW